MSDKKISQLTALAASGVAPSTDVMAVVDTNVTETKKITVKDVVDGALNTQSANGVVYLNGSKEATAGSVVTYDGTTFKVDGAAVFNDSGADVDFRIESDTDANAFFLDGANGNVGIGTDSPATQLVLSANNDGISAGTAPNNTLRFNDTDTAVATGQPIGRLEFYINDASTGGTGIATAIESRSAGTTGGGILQFSTSLGGSTGTLIDSFRLSPVSGAVFNEDGADIDFRVESDTNTHAFFVQGSDGNVGIGTTSPGALLDVRGSAIFNEDGADVDFRIESDTDANAFFLDGATGNLGIGTSSPLAKLHVTPSGAFSTTYNNFAGDGLFIDSSNATDGAGNYGGAITWSRMTSPSARKAAIAVFQDTSDVDQNGLAFFVSNAAGLTDPLIEAMRITSAGELLVGGTTAIGNAAGRITVEGSNVGGVINLFRNDTSIVAGNGLGVVDFYGNDTTSNTPILLARIGGVASGIHSAGDNPTDVIFETTPDGTETVAEAGRVTQAGSYVLKGGTITNEAGVGIIFPATQVASANANSLDDYEEGTWTPAWAFSTSGSVTLATATGKYTKIGNVVHAHCFVSSSAISSPTGDATITGFPFSSATTSGAAIGLVRRFATAFGTNLRADIFGTTVSFYVSATDAGSVTYLQGSDFSPTTGHNQLRFDVVYQV
jgi:redox-sensitive bicupin YhaK (pirin superfamily)